MRAKNGYWRSFGFSGVHPVYFAQVWHEIAGCGAYIHHLFFGKITHELLRYWNLLSKAPLNIIEQVPDVISTSAPEQGIGTDREDIFLSISPIERFPFPTKLYWYGNDESSRTADGHLKCIEQSPSLGPKELVLKSEIGTHSIGRELFAWIVSAGPRSKSREDPESQDACLKPLVEESETETCASIDLIGWFRGSMLATLLVICIICNSTLLVSSRATEASLFNPSAALCSCATSRSEIVCKWLLNTKMPPSAISSPATPMITQISNQRFLFLKNGYSFFLWSARYSPQRPATSKSPNNSNASSDHDRNAAVVDFDNDKSVPIRLFTFIGGFGFVLQGVCLLVLVLIRIRRRKTNV